MAARTHDIYGIDSGTFLVLRTRRVHTLKVKRMHVHVHVRMHSWVRGAGVYLTAD